MSDSTLPQLSITCTGLAPSEGGEPLGIAFTDKPRWDSFKDFTLVERAAFRALCSAIIDALDAPPGFDADGVYRSALRQIPTDDAEVSR